MTPWEVPQDHVAHAAGQVGPGANGAGEEAIVKGAMHCQIWKD